MHHSKCATHLLVGGRRSGRGNGCQRPGCRSDGQVGRHSAEVHSCSVCDDDRLRVDDCLDFLVDHGRMVAVDSLEGRLLDLNLRVRRVQLPTQALKRACTFFQFSVHATTSAYLGWTVDDLLMVVVVVVVRLVKRRRNGSRSEECLLEVNGMSSGDRHRDYGHHLVRGLLPRHSHLLAVHVVDVNEIVCRVRVVLGQSGRQVGSEPVLVGHVVVRHQLSIG